MRALANHSTESTATRTTASRPGIVQPGSRQAETAGTATASSAKAVPIVSCMVWRPPQQCSSKTRISAGWRKPDSAIAARA